MNNQESAPQQSDHQVDSANVLHVAYGPLRDPEIMERIVGAPLEEMGHVAITGVGLVEQALEHLPTPAQDVLINQGVDPNSFRSTGLTTEVVDENGGIGGTLYNLTPEQAQRLDEYELTESGWFQRQDVQVTTPQGENITASTHVLPESSQSSGQVVETGRLNHEQRATVLKQIDQYNSGRD